MNNNLTEDLKVSSNFFSQNYKQSNILKTRLQKEDVPMSVRQPVYCSCKTVACGDMIRCDGPNCKILWYHFECVNLLNVPKSSWICSNCKKEDSFSHNVAY